jgi:hypothetical protein
MAFFYSLRLRKKVHMLRCASSGACSEQSEESPSLLRLCLATITAYVFVRLIPEAYRLASGAFYKAVCH